MKLKNLAIKRINKDIKEINENPIEGIGIISLDNDISKYIANIKLLTGPYKDYCVQLLLTFPEDYPIKPPKVLIYPGQPFDNLYHHHIYNDESKNENGICFKKLCIDLLDNDFLPTKNENTGWNPSYTISTLLMQLQIFLSDPDLNELSMPKPYQIKELKDSMNNYKREFIIKDENGEKIITHTWKEPYPKMYFKEKENINEINNLIHNDKNKNEIIKENLTCFITKLNFFDDASIILGYPIVKENSNVIYPLPEILSYEGYLIQMSKEQPDDYENSLKSANNKYYHAWLPIFINRFNFELNKQTILNSFSVIKFGISGEESYDFKPEYFYEIMFKLINNMISDIKEKKLSNSYLRAFFQYILLFKKLSEIYPYDIKDYKKIDLSSKYDIIQNIKESMTISLFDKFSKLEEDLNKIKKAIKNNLAFQFFYSIKECHLINPDEFIKYFGDNYLFNSIYEIMRFERNIFLYNGKNLKKFIKNKIRYSFKEFLFYSDSNTRNKIKRIILEKIPFYDFINFNEFLNYELDEKNEKNIKDIYNTFIILQYIKNKINEDNLINQLENNFGVYLDIEKVIKKLTEMINDLNKGNYNDAHYLNKSFCEIVQKIIKELVLLSNNLKEEILIIESSNFTEFMPIFETDLIEPLFRIISFYRPHRDDIELQKKNNLDFYKLENMKYDDLKCLYLYSFERLKKRINLNNKKLSLIESIFIEYSLNNNKSYEWCNYISERQIFQSENNKSLNEKTKNNLLNEKQIISLFFEAKKINQILFEKYDPNKIINIIPLLNIKQVKFNEKIIIKNIIKFAELISGYKFQIEEIKYDNNNFFLFSLRNRHSFSNYYVDKDGSLIKKLKEIYDKEDITLLTFYEFIWFEENYNICKGFLSALKNQTQYNYQIRDNIKKIYDANNKKIKRRNKIEKRFKNMYENKIFENKNNNGNNYLRKKLNFKKNYITKKEKRKNIFKKIIS